jgi:hypothetical protein
VPAAFASGWLQCAVSLEGLGPAPGAGEEGLKTNLGTKPTTKLRIGEAFAWKIDNRILKRSDQSSVAHRVEGMPLGLRAMLCPAWTYVVHREEVQVARGEGCYQSKEDAFAGLKNWLRGIEINLARQGAAAKPGKVPLDRRSKVRGKTKNARTGEA